MHVRKDVECTFGILKGRFRILKTLMLYQHKDQIDNVFWTACILHNMLLMHDGLDKLQDWMGADGEHDMLEVEPDDLFEDLHAVQLRRSVWRHKA